MLLQKISNIIVSFFGKRIKAYWCLMIVSILWYYYFHGNRNLWWNMKNDHRLELYSDTEWIKTQTFKKYA